MYLLNNIPSAVMTHVIEPYTSRAPSTIEIKIEMDVVHNDGDLFCTEVYITLLGGKWTLNTRDDETTKMFANFTEEQRSTMHEVLSLFHRTTNRLFLRTLNYNHEEGFTNMMQLQEVRMNAYDYEIVQPDRLYCNIASYPIFDIRRVHDDFHDCCCMAESCSSDDWEKGELVYTMQPIQNTNKSQAQFKRMVVDNLLCADVIDDILECIELHMEH